MRVVLSHICNMSVPGANGRLVTSVLVHQPQWAPSSAIALESVDQFPALSLFVPVSLFTYALDTPNRHHWSSALLIMCSNCGIHSVRGTTIQSFIYLVQVFAPDSAWNSVQKSRFPPSPPEAGAAALSTPHAYAQPWTSPTLRNAVSAHYHMASCNARKGQMLGCPLTNHPWDP